MTLKMTEIKVRVSSFESKLGKLAGNPVRLRDMAKKKEISELEALETKALNFLRYHQKESILSKDQLFMALDANKDKKISEAEFVKFFGVCKRPPKAKAKADGDAKAKAKAKAEDEAEAEGDDGLETAPEDEGLRKVFKSLDGDGKGFLTNERFAFVVRHLMKTVQASILSKELKTDSEAVRKLERGEIVEVLEGPLEDEESKTKRVKVSAMRDKAEGYVTVVGNSGALFLRDGGRIFKVLRETLMTDDFELEEAPKEKPTEPAPAAAAPKAALPAGPVSTASAKAAPAAPASADDDAAAGARKLKAGELVEVIEYPRKDEKSGSMRLKCKAKSDGHVGYATSQGNTGAVFMDCV